MANEYHDEVPHVFTVLNMRGGSCVKDAREVISNCIDNRAQAFNLNSSATVTAVDIMIPSLHIQFVGLSHQIDTLEDLSVRTEFRAMDTLTIKSARGNTVLDGYFGWEFDFVGQKDQQTESHTLSLLTQVMDNLIVPLDELCREYCTEMERVVYDTGGAPYQQGGNCYFGYYFLTKPNLKGLKVFLYKGKRFCRLH